MGDHKKSFPSLGHTEFDGIEQMLFDCVAKPLKLCLNPMEVLPVAIHHSAHVFEQRQSRFAPPHRSKKGRESITVIEVSVLKPPYAERLTRRPADYGRNTSRVGAIRRKKNLMAFAA